MHFVIDLLQTLQYVTLKKQLGTVIARLKKLH